MEEALSEARRALLLDEVPVGAVVVSADGTIIGRGHNAPVSACNPAAHAELAALRQAAETSGNYRLNGAVLIVTLEPCLMCTGAVVHSRLRGLVFGACDYKTGAVCSRMEGLDLPFHNHKTVWAGGVKQNECGELLSDFFRARRQAAKKSEQT
ncbi:MAG: tRNA adenosine(34) deaminase TadA [Desulfovibrionaceae bacterium]|nr:tRNA adenosine(34) deaminase TadA [Desulfovibrionaceae bacterium]